MYTKIITVDKTVNKNDDHGIFDMIGYSVFTVSALVLQYTSLVISTSGTANTLH